LWFIQCMLFDIPSNAIEFKPLKISYNFDVLWWNIKWHPNCTKIESLSIHKFENMLVKFFFPFLRFSINLYEVGCQDCQNEWLSMHPHPYIIVYMLSKMIKNSKNLERSHRTAQSNAITFVFPHITCHLHKKKSKSSVVKFWISMFSRL
jgi:hypothetical protein